MNLGLIIIKRVDHLAEEHHSILIDSIVSYFDIHCLLK
jgi:hypothetical protein